MSSQFVIWFELLMAIARRSARMKFARSSASYRSVRWTNGGQFIEIYVRGD